MVKAALIDMNSNIVANVIILGAGYDPPSGFLVVESDTARIGDSYANGIFTSPPVVPAAPQVPDVKPISVQVNSASSPLLNAVYSITPQAMTGYKNLVAQVQAFGSFPNGAVSTAIADANGIPHSFTVAAFQTFYNAVAYYSDALASGLSPQSPLTIQ
jgi:hypothetical protein